MSHLPTCAALLQVGPRDTLIGLAVKYHVSVSADAEPPCRQLPGRSRNLWLGLGNLMTCFSVFPVLPAKTLEIC